MTAKARVCCWCDRPAARATAAVNFGRVVTTIRPDYMNNRGWVDLPVCPDCAAGPVGRQLAAGAQPHCGWCLEPESGCPDVAGHRRKAARPPAWPVSMPLPAGWKLDRGSRQQAAADLRRRGGKVTHEGLHPDDSYRQAGEVPPWHPTESDPKTADTKAMYGPGARILGRR